MDAASLGLRSAVPSVCGTGLPFRLVASVRYPFLSSPFSSSHISHLVLASNTFDTSLSPQDLCSQAYSVFLGMFHPLSASARMGLRSAPSPSRSFNFLSSLPSKCAQQCVPVHKADASSCLFHQCFWINPHAGQMGLEVVVRQAQSRTMCGRVTAGPFWT